MKKKLIPAALAAFLSLAAVATAADKTAPKLTFGGVDSDHDGRISLREFGAAQKPALDATAAKAKFAELDKNKDGYLSHEEFTPKRKPRTKEETASR